MKPIDDWYNYEQLLEHSLDVDGIVKVLLSAKNGTAVLFNQFQEGGAMVLVKDTHFALYEIPLYGGEPSFIENFHKDFAKQMVETALSFT